MKHTQYPSNLESLLKQGIEYDQANDVEHASQCYQRLLEIEPQHPYALYLLGTIAFRQKKYDRAIKLISKAIEAKSSESIFHLFLGHSLRESGNFSASIDAYERLLSSGANAAPGHLASAYHGKGLCLNSLSEFNQAIRYYQEATRINPQAVHAYLDCANLLRDNGNFNAATKCLEELVQHCPDNADAHINLGHAYLFQEEYKQALTSYQQASRLQPNALTPKKAIGDVLLRLGRYEEARKTYYQCYRLSFDCGSDNNNSPGNPHDISPANQSQAIIKVSAFYLEEAAGHIEHLINNKIIGSSYTRFADTFRSLRDKLPAASNPNRLLTLSQQEIDRIREVHGKILHYADTPNVPSPLINNHLDFDTIENEYYTSPTAVITIDQFLSPSALETLRTFCLESTIFFEQSASGFLSSYIHQGFNCSLLYTIAEELKERFPKILDSKELRNMWIYRHPDQTGGVKAHTDQAAVTFNFWITADDANLDPDHGGLIVYLKEQPSDWDWHQINYHKHDPAISKKITAFLDSSETVTIPYRENRALLFHSNLFHKSDLIHFKDGYENRRMNITMLFGDRDKHVGDGIRNATA